MDPQEWDGLPWYEKNYLIDGLQAEGIIGPFVGPVPSEYGSTEVRQARTSGAVANMTTRSVSAKIANWPPVP